MCKMAVQPLARSQAMIRMPLARGAEGPNMTAIQNERTGLAGLRGPPNE
jgi:hypothetical protein